MLGIIAATAACASGGATTARRPPAPPPTAGTSSADERDVSGEHATRTEQLFIGRFPGVQVYPAGGGVLIRVRGPNTLIGSQEPLIVLDGLPLTQGNGGVLDVPPNDIARIEVVRSAADLAMYGTRGGNGVIRVTTKRGKT